jgi:hypothetical protein
MYRPHPNVRSSAFWGCLDRGETVALHAAAQLLQPSHDFIALNLDLEPM